MSLLAIFCIFAAYLVYILLKYKIMHPLQLIAGPRPKRFIHNQIDPVLKCEQLALMHRVPC